MENNDIARFTKVDTDLSEKGVDVSRLSYIQNYYRNQAADLLSDYDFLINQIVTHAESEELSSTLKRKISGRLLSLGKEINDVKDTALAWLVVLEWYESIKEQERSNYYKRIDKKYFTISSIADALSCSRDTLTDKKNDHLLSEYIDLLKVEYESKRPESQSVKQQNIINELEEKVEKMVYRDNDLMQLRYDYEKLYKSFLDLKSRYDKLSADAKKKDEELWKLKVERGDIQFR